MTRSFKHLVVLVQTWVPFVILADGRYQQSGERWLWLLLTKVLRFITPALAPLMWFSLWAMLERFVAISDIIEEMLKQAAWEPYISQANWCSLFGPSLQKGQHQYYGQVHHPNAEKGILKSWVNGIYLKQYLIVESALFIEEVKELGICFASPKVQISNFEVTPDYKSVWVYLVWIQISHQTHSGSDYMSRLRRPKWTA